MMPISQISNEMWVLADKPIIKYAEVWQDSEPQPLTA